ncbi:cell division protein ZapA [Qipengyuania aurantiaca]|uniref:Cell division protein ZapA n=1 Tax=Qipengyuania aurantiaca TaxID=2867233 RepID=A0ABX8ZLK3_9SPHN|nr:cell division protein ZapA [Qipengyuania aurantiaca]QZD89885.1 cell division protein ZapA [Qipengyuania aurantiaca]
MSEVKLEVGGRRYTVSVADGQEDNLRGLAATVDAKLAGMGKNVSSNEAKNLLFAAILLADELEDAKKKLAAPAAPPPPPPAPEIDTHAVADKLEGLAVALENAASRLEGAPQGS